MTKAKIFHTYIHTHVHTEKQTCKKFAYLNFNFLYIYLNLIYINNFIFFTKFDVNFIKAINKNDNYLENIILNMKILKDEVEN